MNRISVKVKADSWLTTAANEIRQIQTRWGIPSQRKFAVLLGINGRTLAKLYADPPDASICPFICTLIKYNMVYVRACFKLVGVQFQKWKKVNSLRIEFMELAQKIKV